MVSSQVYVLVRKDKKGDREYLCDRDALEVSKDYSKVSYFHTKEDAEDFLKENKKDLKGFFVE